MPIPTPGASVSIMKGKAKSGKLRTRALLIASFSCSKALMAFGVQVNWSFAKSCVNDVAIAAYPLMNRHEPSLFLSRRTEDEKGLVLG